MRYDARRLIGPGRLFEQCNGLFAARGTDEDGRRAEAHGKKIRARRQDPRKRFEGGPGTAAAEIVQCGSERLAQSYEALGIVRGGFERPSSPPCQEIEQRGQDVDMRRGSCDFARSESWRNANQRHAQRRVVREAAVRGFSMIAQRLAVIGRYDDHGALQLPSITKLVEGLSQRRLRPRNFPVVGCTAACEVCRRTIRRVRIEEMHPGEPRPLAAGRRRDPRRRGLQHAIGRTFDEMRARGCARRAVVIVVHVEASVQSESRIEHECSDERARAIAGTVQDLASVAGPSPSRKAPLLRTPW